MVFITKSWKAGIMWRPYSFEAISTDESWYYIMELALAQETSDGNCGPSPSSKMTQWIGHTPKWLGIRCSTETRGSLFLEKAGKICIPLERRNLITIFHHLNLYQSDSKTFVVGKAGDSVKLWSSYLMRVIGYTVLEGSPLCRSYLCISAEGIRCDSFVQNGTITAGQGNSPVSHCSKRAGY